MSVRRAFRNLCSCGARVRIFHDLEIDKISCQHGENPDVRFSVSLPVDWFAFRTQVRAWITGVHDGEQIRE